MKYIAGATDYSRLFPLAYAKATRNQLWVPLLEKAYAKVSRLLQWCRRVCIRL